MRALPLTCALEDVWPTGLALLSKAYTQERVYIKKNPVWPSNTVARIAMDEVRHGPDEAQAARLNLPPTSVPSLCR